MKWRAVGVHLQDTTIGPTPKTPKPQNPKTPFQLFAMWEQIVQDEGQTLLVAQVQPVVQSVLAGYFAVHHDNAATLASHGAGVDVVVLH